MRKHFLTAVLSVLFASAAAAGPGDFDFTYDADGILNVQGAGGITITTVYNREVMTHTSDGKMIVALPVGNTIQLKRYNANGSTDTAFNPPAINLGNVPYTTAMLTKRNGKIMVGGRAGSNNGNAFLMQVMPDGTLDSSFGNAGVILTAGNPSVFDIKQRNIGGVNSANVWVGYGNGKIAQIDETGSFSIVQLPAPYEAVLRLAVLADDSVIAATSYLSNVMSNLWKINPNGTINDNFTNNFANTVGIWLNPTWVTNIMQQSNGELLVTGTFTYGTSSGMMMRLTDDGMPGTSFANGSSVKSTANAQFWSTVEQPDGKLVTVGSYKESTNQLVYAHWRFTSIGNTDTSFGDAGKKVIQNGYGAASQVCFEPNFKIKAGGRTGTNQNTFTRLLNNSFDVQPNNFASFPNQNNVPFNTWVESGQRVIEGLTPGVEVPVWLDRGEYKINGGSWVPSTVMGRVTNADIITIRHQTAGTASTTVTSKLLVGGWTEQCTGNHPGAKAITRTFISKTHP